MASFIRSASFLFKNEQNNKRKLTVHLGNTLNLVLLFDGVGVSRLVGGVDQLISQALSDGLQGAEGGGTGLKRKGVERGRRVRMELVGERKEKKEKEKRKRKKGKKEEKIKGRKEKRKKKRDKERKKKKE